MKNTVVLDIGGILNKFGSVAATEPRQVPNHITKVKNERRRVFIGEEMSECKDFSGIFYVIPFQKGFLVNWDVQRQLFDHMFEKDSMGSNCEDTNLIYTEPQFNFTSIRECLDEMLFEEYRFSSVCRKTSAELSWWKRKQEASTDHQASSRNHLCCLVVDSGFSFTHIVPICKGKIVKKAVRRIDIGGKILTNHLKDIVSYRQLHVLDETYVMNQVKEDCCFVSQSIVKDLEISQYKGSLNTIARDYVLPDYMNIHRGFMRPLDEMWSKYTGTEQTLKLNNERFTVPELLFNPSCIGVQQMGIPELIFESISSMPTFMQPHFYSNIVLTGGNTLFPGFKERVYNDVRLLAPIKFEVNVYKPEDPVSYAWHGGKSLSEKEDFESSFSISRSEYEEHGRNLCHRKFEQSWEENTF